MTIRLLTPTEERVARLVASGRSDLQTGEELGLPRKAVEWHLSRVFRKLGVASRAELPALLRGR